MLISEERPLLSCRVVPALSIPILTIALGALGCTVPERGSTRVEQIDQSALDRAPDMDGNDRFSLRGRGTIYDVEKGNCVQASPEMPVHTPHRKGPSGTIRLKWGYNRDQAFGDSFPRCASSRGTPA